MPHVRPTSSRLVGRVAALATCAAATFVAVSAPGDARAAPSADAIATARHLFQEGTDAIARGDLATARDRFAAAWSLAQTPIIGVALARTHERLGGLVEAREACLAVGRSPRLPDETERSSTARAEADALAAALEPRIARVTIALHGPTPERVASLTFDGVVVPEAARAVPRQTNPGPHRVVAMVGAASVVAEIVVKEGETATATVELPPEAPVSPAPSAQGPPPAAPAKAPVGSDAGPTRTTSPLVGIGLAVGGVGLAVGAVSGAIAMSKASTVRANCQNGICQAPYQSDLSTAQTTATIATVAFVGAGAGAALMIVGLVTGASSHPADEKSPGTSLWLGPGGAGVRGSF
jgi:hypothetical protein